MAADPKQTIVVTGLGVMSGVGPTLDTFWENLLAGKSSLARITHFDPRYAEMGDPLHSLRKNSSRHLSRAIVPFRYSRLVQAPQHTSIFLGTCV
jgi:3-oxoacyl-(acyl-carrier-protein) synthase